EWRVCRGRGLRRRVRLGGRRRRGDRPSGRRLSDGGATRPARLHRHRRQRHVGFLLGRGRGCAGWRLLLIRRDLLWRRRWRLFGGGLIAFSRFRLGLYRAAGAEQRRSYVPGGRAELVSDVPSRWPHRNARSTLEVLNTAVDLRISCYTAAIRSTMLNIQQPGIIYISSTSFYL